MRGTRVLSFYQSKLFNRPRTKCFIFILQSPPKYQKLFRQTHKHTKTQAHKHLHKHLIAISDCLTNNLFVSPNRRNMTPGMHQRTQFNLNFKDCNLKQQGLNIPRYRSPPDAATTDEFGYVFRIGQTPAHSLATPNIAWPTIYFSVFRVNRARSPVSFSLH